MSNPFELADGTQWMDVRNRVQAVERFDQRQCHEALALRHLQKTVQKAIQKRLRQIARDEKRERPGRDVQGGRTKRRTLPQEMDAYLGPFPLSTNEMRTARSLERRGYIRVEEDRYGGFYASWDGEAHAEWIHEQEGVE